MFRILCDPSSGSTELCLTEITHSDSDILSCAWLVFGSVILNLWCVCVRSGTQHSEQGECLKSRMLMSFVGHPLYSHQNYGGYCLV